MPPYSGGIRTSMKFEADALAKTGWSTASFGPGNPVSPPKAEPIRVYDYPVGSNLSYTPRSAEPFGFAQLRAFANVELVRLAIETRKDQIEGLGWKIRSRDEKRPKSGHEERIAKAEALIRRPDGRTDFATWLRAVLEDLFVMDAPAIERRRSLGGELIGLDYVDGATIKVLIDDRGRTPLAPLPAYQQVIKGRVWADLTTDDLIYRPRNVRTNHVYGYGPVEQIVVTINTILQRQSRQLAWFTEGNTPPGLLNAPDGWTPDQIKQYQEWFDAIVNGPAARSKLVWGPSGAKYSPFKDPPLKDDFDEWLARIVCFAFSLPPTAFIKQMNRSTADSDAERSLNEGLTPTKNWVKRLLDGVIQDDLGFADLEFDWVESKDVDVKVQAEIDDLALRNGSKTIDEVRDARGEQPLPNRLGAQPLIYTKDGAIPLEVALARAAEPTDQPKEGEPAATQPDDPVDDVETA